MPDPKKTAPSTPDPWADDPSMAGSGPAAATQKSDDDWKVFQKNDQPAQTINTPGQMAKSGLKVLGHAGSDVLQGLGESVIKSTYGLGKMLLPDWMIGAHPQTDAAVDKLTTPDNKMQGAAKFGGDAAQFLVPGEGEEMAATKLASLAPKAVPLARIGVGALSAGAVNKAQGGGFTQGAMTGGGAGLAGEGMRAVAPSLMKNALRIGSEGLEYDRNTGKSVLEHTTGIRPGTISRQAQEKVGDWNKELDQMAANAPDADMTPIRQAHDMRIAQANYRNSPTEQKLLDRLKQPLGFEIQNGLPTGTPLATNISPHRLRAIKQGVGSEVGNFSPQNQALGAQYKKAIYGDIDKEFNRVVPGSAELDQRMSSLIPAIRAGQKVENAAPMSQRVMHRFAAHTGALAGTVGGAFTGYQNGGLPGAVIGGAAGLLVPEMAVSPAVQAGMARTMNSPATARLVRALATPGARETLDWIKKQNTGTGESK